MTRTGSLDDNIFGDSVVVEKPKAKRGRQEDGTWVTSTGEVLPAKNRNRRTPYPEPDTAKIPGNEEVVETPTGSVAFLAIRMDDRAFRSVGFPERKRLKLHYKVTEVYAGKPRKFYSYDELEQLRRGEMCR